MRFFKAKQEEHVAPPVPDSLVHETYDSKTIPQHADTVSVITPYLGLQARLSQIWFNKWTVLILLVLVHFLLTLGSLNEGLTDARVKALSACTKVEDVGSAMASMPHYLSVGVNQLAASGITHSVQALMTILDMILTGIEQLILFVIGMMTDTYMCLAAMVIHGGLNATALAVEKTTDAMNKGIDGLADGLSSQAENIQKVIDGAWTIAETVSNGADDAKQAGEDAAQKGEDIAGDVGDAIGGLFGRGVLELGKRDLGQKPDVVGDIKKAMDSMKNIQIDSSGFVGDLNDLNDKIPTFDEAKNLTAQAVSIPFDLIRNELDKAYGDWKFDDTVFPVAQKEALSFCSDNSGIADFFEKLFGIASTAKIVAIVLLSLLAIGACIMMAFWEIRKYNRQRENARLFEKEAYDGMHLGYLWSRPTTSRFSAKICNKVAGGDEVRKVMIQWAVAYAGSLPALFVLSLAITGYFSCFCQMILLKAIEKEIPELASQVGDFAKEVIDTLDNVSKKWSDDANGVITSFSSDINDDVLGKVTNATSAVNNTLNTFTNEIDKGLNTVFGDTLFKDLAAGVIRCFIGLKIETLQKGLTWVHDHAHIDFPLFPADVFAAGAQKSVSGDSELNTFLASPSSVTTDEITGAVTHVTDWLRNNIIQDALISTALLLIYVVVVLGGVIYAAARIIQRPPTHGEGGRWVRGDGQSPVVGRQRSRSHPPPSSPRADEFSFDSVHSDHPKRYPPIAARRSVSANYYDEKH
ncbi:plasma membrane fusion protein PRM1 [Xylariomycetidae sp. FL2044]|nr:plasma membrane fusion protein PRM1 [Xylariomycetidae sp. FL2044]